MRVNVNLASRKYEDVRRFYIGWTATLIILSGLTIGLAIFAYWKWSGDRHAAVEARDLQQKVSALQKEKTELRAFENLPENREVTLQKNYWNSQILKRSFSWTLFFNELQKIMPTRAYLNSVQPELTQDNRLKLRINIVGEHKSDDIELIERMEGSKRFHNTRPISEVLEKGKHPGEPPVYKFEIETFYTPAGASSTKAAAVEGS
ncbi:MAG TPA: hypothetical protein VKW06_20310 [Candidatus Angelobacter sp.]|nr:hypothetical protein [Candidatus Angelobacter sp.]